MSWRPTRRAALLGGGAAMLAIGAVGLALPSDEAFVRATLVRLVGPFSMSGEDMGRFIGDFRKTGAMPGGLTADGLHLANSTGAVRLVEHLPGGFADRIEAFERALLTAFTLGTDYFHVADPAKDRLSYVGPYATLACASPFARFD